MKPDLKNKKILSDINFFDLEFPEEILDEFPILADTYLSCLFRSTLPILDKINLVENTPHSKAGISRAISILESHYYLHLFPRRNKELQEYLEQKRNNS